MKIDLEIVCPDSPPTGVVVRMSEVQTQRNQIFAKPATMLAAFSRISNVRVTQRIFLVFLSMES